VPRSGVTYTNELEWRLCAAWANYRFEDWLELDLDEMVGHIAAYRLQNQIDGVLAVDQKRRMASQSGKR
jgi:hypothetical protein